MMWKMTKPMRSLVTIFALPGSVFSMVRKSRLQLLIMAETHRPPSHACEPYQTMESMILMAWVMYAPYMPMIILGKTDISAFREVAYPSQCCCYKHTHRWATEKPMCHSLPIQPLERIRARIKHRERIMTPTVWGMVRPRDRRAAEAVHAEMQRLVCSSV